MRNPFRKKVVKDLYTAADFGDIELLDPEEAEWLKQDYLAEERMDEYIKLAGEGRAITRIFDPLENRTAIFLHKSDQSPESGLLLWSSDQQEAQDG